MRFYRRNFLGRASPIAIWLSSFIYYTIFVGVRAGVIGKMSIFGNLFAPLLCAILRYASRVSFGFHSIIPVEACSVCVSWWVQRAHPRCFPRGKFFKR
jgi:hypothetical protein